MPTTYVLPTCPPTSCWLHGWQVRESASRGITCMPPGGTQLGLGSSRYYEEFITPEFEARLLGFCKEDVHFQLYQMNRTKTSTNGRNPGGWRHIAPKCEFYLLREDGKRGVYYWKHSNDFYQAGWEMPPILRELCSRFNTAFGLEGADQIDNIMIIVNEGGTRVEKDGFSEPFAHCAPLHMDKHRRSYFFDLSLGFARELTLTSESSKHECNDYIKTQQGKQFVIARQRLASASLAAITAEDNKTYKHGVKADPEQPLDQPRFTLVGRSKSDHPTGDLAGEHFAAIDPAAQARVRPGGDLWKEYIPKFKLTGSGVSGTTHRSSARARDTTEDSSSQVCHTALTARRTIPPSARPRSDLHTSRILTFARRSRPKSQARFPNRS